MNIPTQTNVTAVAQTTISAARCALLYARVTNTSGAPRTYVLADAAIAPSLTPIGPSGIRSPTIAAGASWTAFPVDSAIGAAFTYGCVLQSFANDANGNTVFSALSPADANVVAWAAPLQ